MGFGHDRLTRLTTAEYVLFSHVKVKMLLPPSSASVYLGTSLKGVEPLTLSVPLLCSPHRAAQGPESHAL